MSKYQFITIKLLASFNQEMKVQTKQYLTKHIYNKYNKSSELRQILRNILGDVWKEILNKYGKDVFNIVRFYLKGGTAIIETLDYYINITKNDQLSKYLTNIINIDLFKAEQSDWDTTVYVNPNLSIDKFYQVQQELAYIVFSVYTKYVDILSNFFESDRNNLRIVLNNTQFNKIIVEPTLQSIKDELKSAIDIKDTKTIDELTKKLDMFTKSKDRFLKHMDTMTYDLTTNTSYMVQPNIEKLGTSYTYLSNKYEENYSNSLYNYWKNIFGCTQRLPWMKDFTKYVTSKYNSVLLSVNRSIMNQKTDTLRTDSKHHFDLFRFMLCYKGKITWKRNSNVQKDLGFSFPYNFFDYQAELIDISTLNYYSKENNENSWNSADIHYMIPFQGINVKKWGKVNKTPFPISNFMFAIHDIIITLKDKSKIKKRCKRLFILFNIICAMSRQLDLETQLHFKSYLGTWSKKEINECTDGLKELKTITYNNSDIALSTLLANPNLNSSTCSAIFPQLKMPDCDINGKQYPSNKLVEYIYIFVNKIIDKTTLQQIPSYNLCEIMNKINKIEDYKIQKDVAIDIFTRLKKYDKENLTLGDWQVINNEYIMLPINKMKFRKDITKLANIMYNTTFINIFQNINTILPNNLNYIGPVVNRGTMIYKTLGNNLNNFSSFTSHNNIEIDGFYSYGMEFDLWELKDSTQISHLIKLVNDITVKNTTKINNSFPTGMTLISPLQDEEKIRKNWEFTSTRLYEKTLNIMNIYEGIIVSKLVVNLQTHIVINVYILQRTTQNYKSIIIPHIVPILKINIMRRKSNYKIPETISNNNYLGQTLIYYKSYLETIKINIRKKINILSEFSSSILKSESIYVLSRFYCSYYSFLQQHQNLSELLSIKYNKLDIVDLCSFVSNPDNFKNTHKSDIFYNILEKSIDSDRYTTEIIKTGLDSSILSSLPKSRTINTPPLVVNKLKRIRQPEITHDNVLDDDLEKKWLDLQITEETKKRTRSSKKLIFDKCEYGNQCESGCCTYNQKYLSDLYDKQFNMISKLNPNGLSSEQLFDFNEAFTKNNNYKQCSPPEFC